MSWQRSPGQPVPKRTAVFYLPVSGQNRHYLNCSDKTQHKSSPHSVHPFHSTFFSPSLLCTDLQAHSKDARANASTSRLIGERQRFRRRGLFLSVRRRGNEVLFWLPDVEVDLQIYCSGVFCTHAVSQGDSVLRCQAVSLKGLFPLSLFYSRWRNVLMRLDVKAANAFGTVPGHFSDLWLGPKKWSSPSRFCLL